MVRPTPLTGRPVSPNRPFLYAGDMRSVAALEALRAFSHDQDEARGERLSGKTFNLTKGRGFA